LRNDDSVAALPMYDWPERHGANDELWSRIRDILVAASMPAPEKLARRNADMPAVPGGIRDARGKVIAPDPATLPPDEFDVHVLWRHPGLVFAQTCWGPLRAGLAEHVDILWQPDYSKFAGGDKERYRSAIVMRGESPIEVTPENELSLLFKAMGGKRFAYNDPLSMSGILAIREDMARSGAIAAEDQFDTFWSETIETGSHRKSIVAVANGEADVAAIDCRTWTMALEYEPAARQLNVVGWTAPRLGLPYIRAKGLSADTG
jgi:ABC-type phosphate/phosphonate transport system substrate-binding protein